MQGSPSGLCCRINLTQAPSPSPFPSLFLETTSERLGGRGLLSVFLFWALNEAVGILSNGRKDGDGSPLPLQTLPVGPYALGPSPTQEIQDLRQPHQGRARQRPSL